MFKAILGPTNTGKTHYALSRMTGHGSGVIGLPLRLLAREVYDRLVAQKGEAACALLTGEERIEPPGARYYACTVESMPTGRPADFVAVDEVQLAAHRDRGHVFTDRILHARGRHETLLLGSDTMMPLLRGLDLGLEFETRERFSTLSYAGPSKITKLPKRTALVAFSADEVYAIAELLRRQKGGAAVVMGALSPRTRNKQVELYQNGDVDYLVATDAIGMGLNLDVDRVAFAARWKYDGHQTRPLSPAEAGQIAGRAGRFRDDGQFGETGDCQAFGEDYVERIEGHRFDPVDEVQWRNSDLDFATLRSLIASLGRPSGHRALRQHPHALDEWVLRRMAEDSAAGAGTRGERRVRRLWDLARLPDFRKAGHEGHGRLVLGLAETLRDPDARLGSDAMQQRLAALAEPGGSIAQLQQRLAAIRTWTYAAHRPDWLAEPERWQGETRRAEDVLSDALHEALTARFVDRRTSFLLKRLHAKEELVSDMAEDGTVSVEGHVVGRLRGLVFEPDSASRTLEGKAVRGAADAAIRPIIARRLSALSAAPVSELAFTDTGAVTWRGEVVGRLERGAHWMKPELVLIGAEGAESSQTEPARLRLAEWAQGEISRLLPSLSGLALRDAGAGLEGLAKGLAYRLAESGAAIDLRNDDPGHRITPEQRGKLRELGVRAGRVAAYAPDAQKPAPQAMVARLRSIHDGASVPVAPVGAGSFAVTADWTESALLANGYLRFGDRAVRADLAERLGYEISKRRREAGKNLFALPPELASVVSSPGESFPEIAAGFGLVAAERDAETGLPTLWRYGRSGAPRPGRGRGRGRGQENGQGRGAPGGGRGKERGGREGGRSREASRSGDGRERNASDGVRSRKGGKAREGGSNGPALRRQPDPDSPFAVLAALKPEPSPKAGAGGAADTKTKRKRKRGGKAGRGKGAAPGAAGTGAAFTYTPFS